MVVRTTGGEGVVLGSSVITSVGCCTISCLGNCCGRRSDAGVVNRLKDAGVVKTETGAGVTGIGLKCC